MFKSNDVWSAMLILSGFIDIFIACVLWKKRRSPGALACVFGMAAFAIYSFGYSFELISSSIQSINFWLKIEYIGISFIPSLWITTAIQHTKNDNYLPKNLIVLLVLISVLTLTAHYTNAIHHLFYRSISIDLSNGFAIAKLDKGPFYWVHIFWTTFSIAVSIILYLVTYHKSIKTVKRQIAYMLSGCLVPWIFIIIYSLGYTNGIDITPFGLCFTSLFYFLGIHSDALFKINPVVLEKVMDSMKNPVIIFNPVNDFMIANPAFKAIFNFKGSETSDDIFSAYPDIKDIIKKNENRNIEVCISSNEKERFYDVIINVISQNNKIIGKMCIFTDITEKREYLIRLNELATKDELTKIYNRHYFNEQFQKEMKRSMRYNTPLSLILLDIDYFKSVNDNYGHNAGDHVLRNIADILKSSIRENDLTARYGGEEFIILLPETKKDGACEIAERIRKKISSGKMEYENQLINITGSFGVCEADTNQPCDITKILTELDKSLYKAKAEGRNRVVCL